MSDRIYLMRFLVPALFVVFLALFFMGPTRQASAQATAGLQAQIDALLEQVTTLQAQIKTLQGGRRLARKNL